MKAIGIYKGHAHNLQSLALAVKGKGLLMSKRKALDFCKLFPNDNLFYWEEVWRLKDGVKDVRFILKQAKFV